MLKSYKTTLCGLLVIFLASVAIYLGKIDGMVYFSLLSLGASQILAKDYNVTNRKD